MGYPVAQRAAMPRGTGLIPVPVTEALRIPEIDAADPFQLLLSIRRIGARRLEEIWGPGEPQESALRNRKPVVRATTARAL